MENKLLFRCSSVGQLLTDPKTLEAKKAGVLSATARTLVESMWMQNNYGYYEPIVNDYMTKGLSMEQDSMALVQNVLGGQFRTKNRERLQDDYFIGTPDIILKDYVEDIKTSWTLKTFMNAELTPLYMAQAQAYMHLTGLKYYRLIYALVPTDEAVILKNCDRLVWQYGGNYDNEDYIKHCIQLKRNNDLIKDIPDDKRIKVFEFEYDASMVAELQRRIENARKYYLTITI